MTEMIANNQGLYFLVSCALFIFGLTAALTRKNAIGVFMGVELILNAAGLNFVSFQLFNQRAADSSWLDGHIFTLFIIILAAIEAAVALAIVLRVFHVKRSINPEKLSELSG